MSHFLISVFAMVVVLGFMILIHEFGHYATAKFFKVRVECFSIGFGTRLIGFRRGDTDYRISAIPLGGYVKMSGENPMDQLTGDPGEFLSHPRWQRFIIAVAGPAMNILLAVGLLTGVYMAHYEYPAFFDKPAVIAWVRQDSAASAIGLKPGDRIVRVDGIENPTWEQVYPKVMLSPNQPLDIAVQRGSEIISKTIVPKTATSSEMGSAGWDPDQPIIVANLEPDMPAAKAGIKEGDEIVALDGKPLPTIDALIEKLQETKDKPVQVEALRDGQKLTFNIKPVLAETEEHREQRYRLGFGGTAQMKVVSLPPVAAFERSVETNKRMSLLILELVQKLVRRKVSLRSVEGPIRIGQAAGEAATEKGWIPIMELTSGISLNLGIFNLLPIPILDGGVILLLLVESVIRRDISLQIKERIYQAAFVFLVLFAVMVIYNDIIKVTGLSQRLP